MKLIGKDIKYIITTALRKFNKLEEILDMLSVDMEGIFEKQIKLLVVETTMCEMNNILIEINHRLDVAGAKVYKPEDEVIEII